MVILLQSLRDYFSTLHMGLHGGIYDGGGKKILLLSHMCGGFGDGVR